MKQKILYTVLILLGVCFCSSCGTKQDENHTELETGVVAFESESTSEITEETETVCLESEEGNSSDIEEIEKIEETSNEKVESDEILLASKKEINEKIQKAVDAYKVDAAHTYTPLKKEERDALYEAFLNGKVEIKATENLDHYDSLEADGIKALQGETIGYFLPNENTEEGYTCESFRIPFDDGNEMLGITCGGDVANMGRSYYVFQATTEGLILISENDACYVSGLTTFYPNGLVSVFNRGSAVDHYGDHFLLTSNCEKLPVGSWKMLSGESFYFDLYQEFPDRDCSDYDYVIVIQSEVLGVKAYDLYVDDSNDYNPSYEDTEKLSKAIQELQLEEEVIIHDTDYLFDMIQQFMDAKGLSYDANDSIRM